jgi:DMSO/TMAO reductase YedYZ molybdopterin-dependent catalytic subunit
MPPRPPGPFRRSFWRSPVRGPWLTSVFGLMLLISIPVLFVSGLLSYAAYNPDLSRINDETPGKGVLGFYLFSWPTHPIWLYRLNQGVHVTLGLVLVPVLLFKLWSVLPKLFEWPPLRSPAHALERLSLFLLVGGAVFEFATGILNIQTWYKFPGSFYPLHFYGAWVFIAGFVVHVVIKLPAMVRALRSRNFIAELRTNLASTRPEPLEAGYLVAVAPAEPTISRRGVLAFAGAGSALIALLSVGQSLGGPLRRIALLAPHGQDVGRPDDFQVNQTAVSAGITESETGAAWRLTLAGGVQAPVVLRMADLLRMEQHTASLPIACVEGWSTGNQVWAGVRLRDLARLAGVARPSSVLVQSLERGGAFGQVVLSAGQIMDQDSLLALRVNGADLTPDHGYPARVIVPASPGVHCTKWVASLTFRRLRVQVPALVRRRRAAPAHHDRLPRPGWLRRRRPAARQLHRHTRMAGRRGHRPRPDPRAAVHARRPIRHGRPQAPSPERARRTADQLPARSRSAFRHAAAYLVPADLPAAHPVSRHDDPISGPVPVALACRNRSAVPAVRHDVRPAAARRPH